MKELQLFIFALALLFLIPNASFAQNFGSNLSSLPREKIYAHGMDADVKSILTLVDVDTVHLSAVDKKLKIAYEARFKGSSDQSNYLSGKESDISDLLRIFRDYWRASLLNPDKEYSRELGENIVPFLMEKFPPIRDVKVERDSIGVYLSRYIKSKGYNTLDKIDYQGRLIDLVIWKTQTDTIYEIKLDNKKSKIKVFLLKDFISLGWMEYATLGTHHPGGWVGADGLFCVEKSYDLESEDFRVSFLAHEGRHFLDKKQFQNLKNTDLEYRSKLVELSLAKTTIYTLIEFFITNSNVNSQNAHSVANYDVMNDLSKKIFGRSFERNIEKWKNVSWRKINKAANSILKNNTMVLKSGLAAGL